MPSLTLKLPLHVTARPRQDGTFRVLYEVRRDRPSNWPPTVPLPRTGKRAGDLSDLDEVARICADAKKLAAELEAMRAGDAGRAPPAGSLPAVAALWKQSDWWRLDLKPRTQNFYTKSLWKLEAWSETNGHPHMNAMALPSILAYLGTYSDRPAQQRHLRRTLSALFSFARAEGVVAIHPLGAPVRLRKRRSHKRPVHLWTRADVAAYRDAAHAIGWSGGALLIWLMWETGADASDVVTWQKSTHFRDTAQPAVMFTRGKTGEAGVIPISAALADAIRANGALYFVTNPQGAPYAADSVQDDNRRGRDFERAREAVLADGGRRLLMDHLRHSAATDAIESGASFDDTTALSLHADEKMLREVYVQMTEKRAAQVQRLRGIIP